MTMTEQLATIPLLAPHRIPNLPPSFYYIPNFITEEEEASILTKIPPNRWTHLSHRRLQPHPSSLHAGHTLLAAPLPPFLCHPILPRLEALGAFKGTKHGAPNHVLVNEYRAGEGIMRHEDGEVYEPVVATVSLGGFSVLEITHKSGVAEEQVSLDESGASGTATAERVMGTDAEIKSDPNITSDSNIEPNTSQHADQSCPPPPGPLAVIFQEPRSLLITHSPAYSTTLHSIPAVPVDTGLHRETVANWDLLDAGTREDVERNGGVSDRGVRVSLTYRDVRKVSTAGRWLGGGGMR